MEEQNRSIFYNYRRDEIVERRKWIADYITKKEYRKYDEPVRISSWGSNPFIKDMDTDVSMK